MLSPQSLPRLQCRAHSAKVLQTVTGRCVNPAKSLTTIQNLLCNPKRSLPLAPRCSPLSALLKNRPISLQAAARSEALICTAREEAGAAPCQRLRGAARLRTAGTRLTLRSEAGTRSLRRGSLHKIERRASRSSPVKAALQISHLLPQLAHQLLQVLNTEL